MLPVSHEEAQTHSTAASSLTRESPDPDTATQSEASNAKRIVDVNPHRRLDRLDGLRAVAVILVVITHHRIIDAGWIGVDFFFALSGYLITTILLKTKANSTYWRDFWVKRVTRIMPPLVLLISLCLVLELGINWKQALLYLASFGDVMAIVRDKDSLLRPLWSLAVEEHFYLLWPIAVRLLSRRKLVVLLTGLLIAEPVARGVFTFIVPGWAIPYFLTPFRLDGLCFGSLLALAMDSDKCAAFLQKWSLAAMCLVTAIWFTLRIGIGRNFTRAHPTPFFNAMCYSLVPMASVFLVAYLLTRPQSILARVLSWKPFVQIGLISYGIYLFHELGIAIALRIKPALSRPQLLFINVPVVLLFSWLSFNFYELPIMRRGKRMTTSGAEDRRVPAI